MPHQDSLSATANTSSFFRPPQCLPHCARRHTADFALFQRAASGAPASLFQTMLCLSAGAPLVRPPQLPRRSLVTPGHAHAPANGPLVRRGLGLLAPAPALPIQALPLPVPPLPPLPTALLYVAGAIAGMLLLRILREFEARQAEREQAAYGVCVLSV